MSIARFKTWVTAVVPVLLLVGSATAAVAQGTISGRLTDAASNQPVPEARVLVTGTNIFAISNAEARYTLRNVSPGSQLIRVLRVGYLENKRTVTVNVTSPTALDIAMTPAVVKLQEVVTPATGD